MVRIEFDGKLKSKGHPPSKWDIPKWLYRMFVWEKVSPIFIQQDFDEGEVKFAENFGVFGVTAGEYDGIVSVTLYAMGYPVVDYKQDVNDVAWQQKIKWSAAGQKIEGTFTVSMS